MSAQTYYGVQVLRPQYLTLVSIFVRPFLASTSAAFETVVMSLGPPLSDERDIRSALQVHDRNAQRSRNPAALSSASGGATSTTNTGHTAFIEAAREILMKARESFLMRSDYSLLRNFHWNDDGALLNEKKAADALQADVDDWIGRFFGEVNWREANSRVTTQDLFGAADCRATVRALYDHVARHMLTALEARGFDIAQYKDSTGRWSINVDKIDQMIVGEKISVEDARAVAKPEADSQADS